MENTISLDANALLGWPKARARELFHGSTEEAKTVYRRLVHRWHPDHSRDPRAHEVFIHLQGLYEAAGRVPAAGREVRFQAADGRVFRFQARREYAFELGTWYRGRGSIAFKSQPTHARLHAAFQDTVAHLGHANDKMRRQMAPLLPALHAAHTGPDGGLLVVRKDPEAILLADLHAHLQTQAQPLDARHVGWILNGLHNIACYLSHAQLAHQGITPATVWINPAQHSVQLLGGWFHSLPFGTPIRTLPAEVANTAPRSCLREKIASPRLDLESIRALGRWLLGDVAGQRLHPDAPAPLVSMLRLPASGTAVEEYQRCKQALHASFGPPTFVPMELSHHDIYPGE